jgi:hypothetical protein
MIFLKHTVLAQESGCKVLVPAIADSYSGGCKNGLAHGKGIAKGIDTYEGQFSEGFQDGTGTYTWADGKVYKGLWEKGLKEGKGKLIYHLAKSDSIVSGFWKNDHYAGDKFIPAYRIVRSMGVVRTNFRKISEKGSDVAIKILIGGKVNSDIEEFAMAYDTGNQYQTGSRFGIQNALFPLEVKITYRTWNQLHSTQYDVIYEFVINDPGIWDITINN